MRGTLGGAHAQAEQSGIIPAYAGNTWHSGQMPIRRRDHPRVCGEHRMRGCWTRPISGSSPRMRGTLRTCGSSTATPRIIPAYAGNTQVHMAGRVPLWDHPRVCGEHNMSRAGLAVNQGSSPRMRGTLVRGLLGGRQTGIIPAYAGNTGSMHAATSKSWDHPRVCGEHLSTFLIYVITKGSSPRMRGTLLRHRRRMRSGGIIPAYAGNTCVYFVFELCCRDHPRVCGEHIADKMRVLAKKGSSPRMRGTPSRCP